MVYLTFQHPVYLWFLLLIPLLYAGHYLFLARNQTKAMRFANFVALKRISGERFVTKNLTVLILRTFAIFFLITSLTGATLWYTGEVSEYDYTLAIDVSPSMVTKDISPSRLEFAKEFSSKILDEFESNAKFGLVTFSSVTYIMNPLTEVLTPLKININSLNVSKSGGTDISNAIIASTNVLASSQRGKSIIIFTDGINTAGASMDNSVIEAVDYAKNQQVTIHTVGLATDNAPVGYLPELYNLKTNLDKETLDYISSETGGNSIYPVKIEELSAFITTLEESSDKGEVSFDFEHFGILFAFIFIIIEWILINLTFRRVV